MNFKKMKKIVIGCDHGGFSLKQEVTEFLIYENFEIEDVGTYSEESCHYPHYAHQVAQKVAQNRDTIGILICTTGQGMVISANKNKGIRASLCWNKEIARLAREHNNANILCLPANYTSTEDVLTIINEFLSTEFLGERHLVRVDLIESL